MTKRPSKKARSFDLKKPSSRKRERNIDWNLNLLYKSDNSTQILIDRKKSIKKVEIFSKKWQKNESYLTDPEILRCALDEYALIEATCGLDDKENFYFSLKNAQNQDNVKIKSKGNKASEVARKLVNKIQFFFINLAKVDAKTQKLFLKSEKLTIYRHFLEMLFNEAKYILSDKEERILTMLSKTSYGNWVDMLERLLSKSGREIIDRNGQKKMMQFSEITKLFHSSDFRVVDAAAKGFYDILKEHEEVAENELNSVLEYKKQYDELKNFDRPDKSRHIAEDLDSTIVDTMINTVTSHFQISQRYYKFKAKLLKKSQIKYHQRLMNVSHVDKKISYKNAVQIIKKTFVKLDQEFADIYENYLEEGRFDVYPKKFKQSGAFCSAGSKFLPTFILLNYNGNPSDVTTIAHEMGHAINYEYSKKEQNPLNWEVPLLVAEFSSTFFEDYSLEVLMDSAGELQKFYLLLDKLEDSVGSIFRQTALYNFETALHKAFREKGYLSSREIGQIFAKHMRAYLGSAVDFDKNAEKAWIHWSHIRNFFYVFSYVGGLLISKAIQQSVSNDPKFIKKVRKIFACGSSVSPKMAFIEAKINIASSKFWQEGLEKIEKDLKEAEKMAKNLKLI